MTGPMESKPDVVWSSGSIFESCVKLLESASYVRVAVPRTAPDLPATRLALFEDQLGIVLITAFDSLEQLIDDWRSVQQVLVGVLEGGLAAHDAKSWEGYIVLMAPSEVAPNQVKDVIAIRHDTNYARKLVVTANEYGIGGSRLALALAPLLPIPLASTEADISDPLDELADEVSDDAETRSFVNQLVKAYKDGLPLLDAAYRERLAERRGAES